MDNDCHDPRILRVYAERLALQSRDVEIADLIAAHLPAATTDPGWAELASWYQRHQARRLRTLRQQPTTKGTSTQPVRPSTRRRPNPYAIGQ